MDFVTENWELIVGAASALVLLFAALAARTANKTDDKIAAVLKRWLRLG